jgi:hypothetical protein
MDKDIYETTSLHLATFLCIKGFDLINIKNIIKGDIELRRKVFVFKYSDQIEEMVRVFYFSENNDSRLQVNARNLLGVFRDIKNKLHALNLEYHNKNKGQD